MDDSATALSGLYQGEKTDAAYIFSITMGMMGFALAYIGGLLAASDKFGAFLPWPLVLLLPAPLAVVVVYQSLMTLNAMSHGVSVQIIEDALYRHSKLPRYLRKHVGSASGDRIMDVTCSALPHQIATFVVYGGVALGVFGFTIYVLMLAAHHVHWAIVLMATIGYSAALGVCIWSWVTGSGIVKEGRDRLEAWRKGEIDGEPSTDGAPSTAAQPAPPRLQLGDSQHEPAI